MQNFVPNSHRVLSLFLLGLLVCSASVNAKTIEEMEADAIKQKQEQDALTKPKKTAPEPPKPKPIQTYALTVKTEPTNATVSIRNIQPKYRDGIQLEPGKYHIRVSASGYQTQDKWIELGKANRTMTVALNKLPPPPEPVVAAPVTPAPAPVAQPQPAYPSVTTAQNRIAGRYIDHGNGTITDSQTRLMWKKCSEGQSGNACSSEAATYK
ncbi:PEGA domain-containing protein [Thiothrix nivea]|nr:PEGA domain-containing protein [Thiothrix nivea]